MYKNVHLFLKKEVKSHSKYPSCKKSCKQDLKKGYAEKDVKSKAKTCAGMLLITLNVDLL